MGQKVNPHGLRLGIIRDWDAKWYADRNFSKFLHEDLDIRSFIKKRFSIAGVDRVEVERAANRIKLSIHTARPGMIIGRRGSEVDSLKQDLEEKTGKKVSINIVEVKKPEINAQLVAENIAAQIEKRISFRRAMRQAVQRAMKLGAEGIKVQCSGRLGGAEMSRREGYNEGKVPLHTLRADIDYGFTEAFTTYGQIGIKVWIYKGEVLPEAKANDKKEGGE